MRLFQVTCLKSGSNKTSSFLQCSIFGERYEVAEKKNNGPLLQHFVFGR
jgi:hypothetical protein